MRGGFTRASELDPLLNTLSSGLAARHSFSYGAIGRPGGAEYNDKNCQILLGLAEISPRCSSDTRVLKWLEFFPDGIHYAVCLGNRRYSRTIHQTSASENPIRIDEKIGSGSVGGRV